MFHQNQQNINLSQCVAKLNKRQDLQFFLFIIYLSYSWPGNNGFDWILAFSKATIFLPWRHNFIEDAGTTPHTLTQKQ